MAKNESANIARCVQALIHLADEVLVCDTGSNDDTIKLATAAGARVIEIPFQGYGATKNLANAAAMHEWILSIDADEVPDEIMQKSIMNVKSQLNNNCVYSFKRLNSYCGKWIKYGAWNPDLKPRLFNKQSVKWNDAAVHETLIIPKHCQVIKLEGQLLHYSYPTPESLDTKVKIYSERGAQALLDSGRKPSVIKLIFSPLVRFIRDYIVKLGILDGKSGFIIARQSAREVYLKYKLFNQLYK